MAELVTKPSAISHQPSSSSAAQGRSLEVSLPPPPEFSLGAPLRSGVPAGVPAGSSTGVVAPEPTPEARCSKLLAGSRGPPMTGAGAVPGTGFTTVFDPPGCAGKSSNLNWLATLRAI